MEALVRESEELSPSSHSIYYTVKTKAASQDKHPGERISRLFPSFGQNWLNAELLVQLPMFQDVVLDGGF